MAQHAWLLYSLASALAWAIGYTASEFIMKRGVEPMFLLLCFGCITLPTYFLVNQKAGTLKHNVGIIMSRPENLAIIIAVSLLLAAGNLLIFKGIHEKNATLAAMIEITYPVFTFVFAWLFLREVQLTPIAGLGACLILGGIILIAWKG